jgi:hypothetical protein
MTQVFAGLMAAFPLSFRSLWRTSYAMSAILPSPVRAHAVDKSTLAPYD